MTHSAERGGGRVRTLGVVGTFVLDRIVGLPHRPDPVEDLGGIAYGLAGAAAALTGRWKPLPIARLGVDAAPSVRAWLAESGLDTEGLLEVPEPNNRVTLTYGGDGERTERLSGGVGTWPLEELLPRAGRCDALLINFISGHELSLEVADGLRRAFSGPIYADLHSLFLDTAVDGTRVPRSLPEWRRWVADFDAVQMNETELDLLRGELAVESVARAVLTLGPALLACTRGRRGAVCWSTAEAPIRFRGDPTEVKGDGDVERREIPVEPVDDADPTGCGDVWAGVACSRLLVGADVPTAATTANRLAAAAARESGTKGLVARLRAAMDGVVGEAGASPNGGVGP